CRVAAGISYVLRHNSQSGHVCLPMDKLVSMTTEFLQVSRTQVEEICMAMEDEETLAFYENNRRVFVYLADLFAAESYIAGRISLMLQLQPPEPRDMSSDIDALEAELGIAYDVLQRRAVEQAAASNVFILTGGPGTGKTTTLNGILTLLEKQGLKVALAAPTGRAAKRMTEVTGREAKTIHRLLEVEPFSENLTFKRNEKNPLPADVIIVDEMSMVDTMILDCLLRGMRLSCKLILVGDSDQLPSVSAGNLLGDMIASEVVPMVHLDRVFRQAAQSLIVTNAHAIVAGELPELTKKDSDFFFLRQGNPLDTQTLTVGLCARRLPAAYQLSPLWDIQVIVPGKRGPAGTQELNRKLQEAINPPSPQKTEAFFMGRTFREGDKVMQIRNNYDVVCKLSSGEESMGIFNGDIGIIDMMDVASKTILVRFDDRVAAYSFDNVDQLELAYAITVHKSQGSEFEAVVMPLCGKHPKLHYRNLLYTGVTRARRLLVMAGSPETVAEMVANNRRTLRYTNLTNMLREAVLGSESSAV
ncbi:MAG: AAA family ATPase, partial [Angelakisella sp.]